MPGTCSKNSAETGARTERGAFDRSQLSTDHTLDEPLHRLHPRNLRQHFAQTRERDRDVLEEDRAAVEMAEFSVGTESLHEALHGAKFVNAPKLRIGIAFGTEQAGD